MRAYPADPVQQEFEERWGSICVDPRDLSSSPPPSTTPKQNLQCPLPVALSTPSPKLKYLEPGAALLCHLEGSHHENATIVNSPLLSSNLTVMNAYIFDASKEPPRLPSPSPLNLSSSCVPSALFQEFSSPTLAMAFDDYDSSVDAEGDTDEEVDGTELDEDSEDASLPSKLSPLPLSRSYTPAKLPPNPASPSHIMLLYDYDNSDDAEGEADNGSDEDDDDYVEELPRLVKALPSRAIRSSHKDILSLKPSSLPLPSSSSSISSGSSSKKQKKGNAKEWPCSQCSIVCGSEGDFKRHLQSIVHTPDRKFKCKACGEGFTRPDALKRHHTGKRCKATKASSGSEMRK